MTEYVVLVDEKDNQVGVEEKLKAHETGALHRAFSIFIYDLKGRLLLQRRALGKYHSAGLWSNSVCSHPRPGEGLEEAAHRRLNEELGFDCALAKAGAFIYKADLDKGLQEHEFDYVFIGIVGGVSPVPNREEVEEIAWAEPSAILDDIKGTPDKYTSWFKQALELSLVKASGSTVGVIKEAQV